MNAGKFFDIWPPETGIADFEVDPSELAVPEAARIRKVWKDRKTDLGDSDRLRLFSDQLNREWAIETGIIENLYYIDRGVTQTFIERGFQEALLQHGSADKDPGLIVALLEDQRNALENLFAFVRQDRSLTTGYIKELHAMMTQSQHTTEAFTPTGERIEVPLIRGDWKREANFPFRDGVQYRYCPPTQTASEMERLVDMHLRHTNLGFPPEVEAAWIHHRFTQVHPFQDGNGRVARALASLVLIRAGMFPLIVPREEKAVYLQSLERADAGDLRSLVLLVSRRQEIALTRAETLLMKLAPEPETLEDAAARLGRVYAKRNDVIGRRLDQRLADFHNWMYSELQSQAKKATSIMRREAGIDENVGGGRGGGGFGSTHGSPSVDVLGANARDQFFDVARSVALDRWNVIAGRPCDAFTLVFRLENEFKVLLHIHALNPETDESMQAVAILLDPETVALDMQPLDWGSDQAPGVLQQLVPKWVEGVLRKSMSAIARHA